MDTRIPEATRAEIEKLISSEESPVGIDAKETHVQILFKLQQIDRRLAALEERLAANRD